MGWGLARECASFSVAFSSFNKTKCHRSLAGSQTTWDIFICCVGSARAVVLGTQKKERGLRREGPRLQGWFWGCGGERWNRTGKGFEGQGSEFGLILKATDSNFEQQRDEERDILLLGGIVWLHIQAGLEVGCGAGELWS